MNNNIFVPADMSEDKQKTILLAEDDLALAEILVDTLEAAGYRVMRAENGAEAFKLFKLRLPHLILSDITMPVMDGFELLAAVRDEPEGVRTPFIFLSARTDRQNVSHSRSLGADNFLFKPFDSDELLSAVQSRFDRMKQLEFFNTRAAHLQTVTMLANAVEARDATTSGHVERVQSLAMSFARYLGWDEQALSMLEIGSLLHDIGKIVVPELILNKPGPLTEEEFAVMRQHPLTGARILQGVSHLAPTVPYILYHHERWDGNGYPYKLQGETIPLEGRLMNLVDSFDAMISDRPYRPGCDKEIALEKIREASGKQFDPVLADQFIAMLTGTRDAL